jgi:pimeloyl-ACP methyl ester carboxylesterase
MATIMRNGVNLAFEDRGAGKPAFVFVHGWTCDRSFFAPQAEHFARRHRVVGEMGSEWIGCTDAPGFDRIAFHKQFNSDVLAFFRTYL